MVYTRLHVLLIDINRIEIGSDSNFGGKVTTSFVNISCLRKNITKYNWYVFTSNKYYVMVYIKDRSEIGFLSQQQVPRSDHSSKGTNKNNFSVFISCGVVYDNTESRNLRLSATCGCLRASKDSFYVLICVNHYMTISNVYRITCGIVFPKCF